MIEGYAVPYTTQILAAVEGLQVTWYTAHNAPSESMKRTERTYNSYRLAFKSDTLYSVKEIKQLLSDSGLNARTVVVHGTVTTFNSNVLYDCRIEIPQAVSTKKLSQRNLKKALHTSDKDADKFSVRFN